jgi:hypothetical protein
MPHVSDELRKEASEAFHAYEQVFIDRIVKRPGSRMDAKSFADALATDDEQIVMTFIANMRRARLDLLD